MKQKNVCLDFLKNLWVLRSVFKEQCTGVFFFNNQEKYTNLDGNKP